MRKGSYCMQRVVVQVEMHVIFCGVKDTWIFNKCIWACYSTHLVLWDANERHFFGILERVKPTSLSFYFGIYGDTKVVMGIFPWELSAVITSSSSMECDPTNLNHVYLLLVSKHWAPSLSHPPPPSLSAWPNNWTMFLIFLYRVTPQLSVISFMELNGKSLFQNWGFFKSRVVRVVDTNNICFSTFRYYDSYASYSTFLRVLFLKLPNAFSIRVNPETPKVLVDSGLSAFFLF